MAGKEAKVTHWDLIISNREKKNSEVLEWPSQSQQINPTENLWLELSNFILKTQTT